MNNNNAILRGPLFWNIVKYTIPIILTSVLQLLFNAADLVVVGRFCGSLTVAAVGATGSVTNLIINLFVGLSVGAGVTVAPGATALIRMLVSISRMATFFVSVLIAPLEEV